MTIDALARSLHISSSMLNDFVGAYRSCVRGIGIDYHDLRAYAPGDDFRAIAWIKSAQCDTLQVKTFQEDRSRTIVIVHDISLSMNSAHTAKAKITQDVANILIASAALSDDYVALATWSDHIDHYIPPQQGIVHAQRLMKHIHTHRSASRSSLPTTLHDLTTILKHKRSVIIIISDFFTPKPTHQTIVDLAYEHDLIFVHIQETIPPPPGWFFAHNPEATWPAWTNHTACYAMREDANRFINALPPPARAVSIPECANYYTILQQFFQKTRKRP